MRFQDFFEKFLPNYDKQFDNFIVDASLQEDWGYTDFILLKFPEALQNFADVICEKQRENCADDSVLNYCREYNSYTIDIDSIRNAKQPKIDEL